MYEIIEELNDIGHEVIGEKLEKLKDSMIIDVSKFKRELERAGLKNEKLEEFIDNYMRWDNLE